MDRKGTHAAVTAKISVGRALLMKPAERAKMVVKAWIKTSLCIGVVVKYRPYIGPTRRFDATKIVTILAAAEMDRSLNRAMPSFPSRVGSFGEDGILNYQTLVPDQPSCFI